MFINKMPKPGEIRYYADIEANVNTIYIIKVKTINIRKVKESGEMIDVIDLRVEDVIVDSPEKGSEGLKGYYREGSDLQTAMPWHLQKTESDAKRLTFVTIFEWGMMGFLYGGAPF